MTPFIIESNRFLKENIQGFYHTDFGGYQLPNNPNYLYKLKNDPHHNWSDYRLREAQGELSRVLMQDLPLVQAEINRNPLTVCVVPRAKGENTYQPNQMLFRATVSNILNQLGNNFLDGTSYLVRHTNTKTTHLRQSMEGFVNDGPEPYPGIGINTCNFSQNISGRDILLIDDIYTRTVNIDEDMLQTLINLGANSVYFYSIGKTIFNG